MPCCRMLRMLMTMIGMTAMNRITASAEALRVLEQEHLVEHPVGDDLRLESPAGRYVDDVEHLQHRDGNGRDHDDRTPDGRHDDAEEDPGLASAVAAGGLDDLARDAFDRGRQDHHREPGLEPDHDQDHQERVDPRCLEPQASGRCQRRSRPR